MGEDFYEHVQIKNGLAKFLIKSYFTKLEEILKKINFSNFLDVGAGNGYVTDYVKKLTNSEAFAIDNNENKIKSIQNKYPFIKSIFANAENIPYP
jgi:ubiquinone/menaquinone biosynthesis C-methylase UbiE